MFTIPYNLSLFKPEIDSVIFIFLIYIIAFRIYKGYLEKEEPKKIFPTYIKISLIIFLAGYINYSGSIFNLWIYQVSWWVYFIVVITIFEIIFNIVFWKDFQLYIDLMKREEVKKTRKVIEELEFFKNIMEDELYMAEKNGDEKSIKNIKKDLKLINQDIQKLKKMAKFDKIIKKNDKKK